MALGDAGGGTLLVTGGALQALTALHIFHIISQIFWFFFSWIFPVPSVFQSSVSHNFPGAAVLVPALSHCLVLGLDGALWHGPDLPFGPTSEGLNLPNPFFLAFTSILPF